MKTREKNNLWNIVILSILFVVCVFGFFYFNSINSSLQRFNNGLDGNGGGSGDVLEYYENGKLKSNYSVNSYGEGVAIYYYDDGNKYAEQEGTFADVKKGFIKGVGIADGLLDGEGVAIWYYKNGNVEEKRKGMFEIVGFNQFGVVQSVLNGKGERIVYYENGNMKEEMQGRFGYYNGRRTLTEGVHVKYYENGNKDVERNGDLINGTGEIISYHENGNKKAEQRGTFKGNELTEGVVIFYYLNGNKAREEKGDV